MERPPKEICAKFVFQRIGNKAEIEVVPKLGIIKPKEEVGTAVKRRALLPITT